MKKIYISILASVFLVTAAWMFGSGGTRNHRAVFVAPQVPESEEEGKDENDKYDGPDLRDEQEARWMMDPAKGYVPYTELNSALAYTHHLRDSVLGLNPSARTGSLLLWQERGPIYDSTGPSNGNTRGNDLYTSGRMRAVLIDTLNDPTGNTAIVGGVAGGVWKCTNFLSPFPNWRIVNDYFDNMAISSICQDPAHPNIMYFSTGEAASNADAHFGLGVWKSTDKGETWTQLPSTVNFIRNWKVVCDNAGNVYLASRTTASPALNTTGLARSKDGGATWVNITPTAQGTATSTATCTDLEYTSTGKLVASFGYLGTVVRAYTTNDPANVTQAAGWTLGTGIRIAATSAVRMEMASLADTLYAVTVNTSYNSDSCYKSIDGGATWTKQNTTVMPTGILSGQGWYNATLAINPKNSNEIMCGGLDAYRSTNGGANWTRQTFWVTTAPYVHADHHNMQWWIKGNESRMTISCDGGIFYSNDGGFTWVDKNRNLSIKQFYGADIHPAAGSPYLLAGAQDNGTHQLKNPGKSYSFEVTGGDGMHVWINQQDPSVQFGSYVYNQYRRSTNGGQTWSSVNFSGSAGQFTNPYAYDDGQNILYACYTANNLFRWTNANTSTTAATVAIAALNGALINSLKVSPYTANRLYLGSTGGRVLKLDAANATPTVTNITGASFPAGSVSCVNTGNSDQILVATYSNYGVAHVWVSSDNGTSWTNVDGNLPNIPVWYALYDPTDNNKMYIGTETGLWATDNLNGASTVWTPDPGLPTTRISMLRMRTSDNTVVAATYGRGLFTAVIPPSSPAISFVTPGTTVTEQTDATNVCRKYKDYVIKTAIVNPPTGNATVTYSEQAGATATEGQDFDFTTNGSFTSPSKQHVFTAGQTGTKDITVRIYDDAQIESTETFVLGFAISGTTNAVAGAQNVHTFTINDNDRAPVPAVNTSFTVGTYNTDLTTLNTPFDGTKLRHRIQFLYRASELQSSGISIAARLSALKLRVKTKNSTQAFKGLNISISHTSKTTLNAGFVTGLPLTTVYQGDYNTVAGDNTFPFLAPFDWDGSSNLLVQICWDNVSGTPEGVTDVVEGMSAPFGAGNRASVYSNYTTGTTSGCSLPAAFVDDNRMNVSFTAAYGNPVATALNSTSTESLGANNDIFFYTASGEIMARVLNLSSFDYGCTQVQIDRAGTGVSQFWNSNAADYLMNKTFRILPGTNNPTGKYEVTFYFTAAEKAGWEAATGHSWSEIQLVKQPGRISNVTPLNAQPDGPGTIQVVNPVRRTYGPVYYTVSFLLENGFSGYGFGVPGRMNTILTLTGNSNANGVDVDLNWTTSVEINSTYFEVEKSYDGTNFHKIGEQVSSFNKLTPSSYGFTDHENVQYNYYRIRMLHTDGYILYSNVLFIKRDNAPQRLIVGPNPFTTFATVRFARPPVNPLELAVYTIDGKLMKRWSLPAGLANYNLDLQSLIPHAMYMLRAEVDGQLLTKKILKQ